MRGEDPKNEGLTPDVAPVSRRELILLMKELDYVKCCIEEGTISFPRKGVGRSITIARR